MIRRVLSVKCITKNINILLIYQASFVFIIIHIFILLYLYMFIFYIYILNIANVKRLLARQAGNCSFCTTPFTGRVLSALPGCGC